MVWLRGGRYGNESPDACVERDMAMLNADEAVICARCGWLTIDDECGCTAVAGPTASASIAALVWATAVAAALIVVALVTVSSA